MPEESLNQITASKRDGQTFLLKKLANLTTIHQTIEDTRKSENF